MTAFPAIAALPEPQIEAIPGSFTHRMKPENARTFVAALASDYGLWGDTFAMFAEVKAEELVEELTAEIPSEYWFTAPGASNAKLLWNGISGFRLLLQTGTAEKRRDTEAINELLKERRYAA
jgi:hypothetical protein